MGLPGANGEGKKAMLVGLIGTPNVGKTMLFNRMTACQACVGNWAGVTAQCAQAGLCGSNKSIEIIDLPGCYNLPLTSRKEEVQSHNEVLSLIEKKQVDILINVVDAEDLLSQLYLTLQLLETSHPLIIVLNRMDILERRGIHIDIKKLESILGVSCHGLSAKTGFGVQELVQLIERHTKIEKPAAHPIVVRYPPGLESMLAQSVSHTECRYEAIKWCVSRAQGEHAPAFVFAETSTEGVQVGEPWGLAETIAQAKHQAIDRIIKSTYQERKVDKFNGISKVLDRYFLHKWLGIPLFFMMMFMVFWLSIGVGQFVQMLLEPFWRLLAIDVPAWMLAQCNAPTWLSILVTQGLGVSIVTSTSFLPVLLCMFTALHFLEESGYMTRAALVIDRLMRVLDLPGESMVALVLGLGCNVPGILATRHIPKEADRILTTMMMPFMSCSARLTIFAVFASVFFAEHAASLLCFLYMVGFAVACLTGVMLRWLGWIPEPTEDTHLLQLPAYQYPLLTRAVKVAWRRSWQFFQRALQVILPVCVLLAFLNHITVYGDIGNNIGGESILAIFGQSVAWVFAPIGLQQSQWPLVVALFTGLLAKEVVISTMGVFYAQDLIIQSTSWYKGQQIMDLFWSAYSAFIDNQQAWKTLLFSLPQTEVSSNLAPYLQASFPSQDHVVSYLIFVLLYFPCVSTLYAAAREVGWKWARLSLLWSCFIAYSIASVYLLISIYFPVIKTLLVAWLLTFTGYWVAKVSIHFLLNKAEKNRSQLAGGRPQAS